MFSLTTFATNKVESKNVESKNKAYKPTTSSSKIKKKAKINLDVHCWFGEGWIACNYDGIWIITFY